MHIVRIACKWDKPKLTKRWKGSGAKNAHNRAQRNNVCTYTNVIFN